MSAPTLHMLCGKIAAGKSSLAAQLIEQDAAVLISEDAWLAALYSDQMATGADYVRCSTKLQGIMRPHVVDLLNAGVSVVLGYAANTVASRAWMRGILEATQVDHQMHVLDVPDEVCLARLKQRNAAGDHPFAATEAQFHRFTQHYVPPTADEGFTIVRHTAR